MKVDEMMKIAFLLLLVTHILIPIVFIWWIAAAQYTAKFTVFLQMVALGAYMGMIFLAGRWDWLGYSLRYAIGGAFIAASLIALMKFGSLPWFSGGLREWAWRALFGMLLLLFVPVLVSAAAGQRYDGEALDLVFPLKGGVYYVAHGGSTEVVNYHVVVPPQKFALDIVKLGRFGTRATGVYPKTLSRYAIFGEPVYAPCSGKVLKAESTFPDLIPPQSDPKNPAGNYVVIDCGKAMVLLAHLRQGSLQVSTGDWVNVGDLIASVGNSGNTSEPHLHIHAIRDAGEDLLEDLLRTGVPVPLTFSGRFLTRNSLVRVP